MTTSFAGIVDATNVVGQDSLLSASTIYAGALVTVCTEMERSIAQIATRTAWKIGRDDPYHE